MSELKIGVTTEYALVVSNPGEEVFTIRGDGALFWRGREVTTDEQLRRALLDAAAVLSEQRRRELEQLRNETLARAEEWHTLRHRIAVLEAALKRYGVHESACPWLEGGVCNCGLVQYA